MKLLLCNVPTADAKVLARKVVTEFGAACVNLIGPVLSVYRWEGKLCEDREMTMVIKVASERAEQLVERLAANHPYDVPEVVSLSVEESSSYAPYLNWVEHS